MNAYLAAAWFAAASRAAQASRSARQPCSGPARPRSILGNWPDGRHPVGGAGRLNHDLRVDCSARVDACSIALSRWNSARARPTSRPPPPKPFHGRARWRHLSAGTATSAYCCSMPASRITLVQRRSSNGGLELRNVLAKYPFERSHRFPVIQPNSGRRDHPSQAVGSPLPSISKRLKSLCPRWDRKGRLKRANRRHYLVLVDQLHGDRAHRR